MIKPGFACLYRVNLTLKKILKVLPKAFAVQGHSKPSSFKLARSNLFGEQGTVWDYMISPENPAVWCRLELNKRYKISTG